MTQASQPTADDIAYLRQLSESGARAPLVGGRFMAWWGLLLVIAYLAQHLAVNGRLGGSNSMFGIIWGSFGVLGLIGQLLLARTIAGKPGQGSAGNLAMRGVWVAGACSIGAMVVGTALISDARVAGIIRPWDFIVPVAFAVYACALGVTGSLAGIRVLKLAAMVAVIMVALFTALVQEPWRYLLVSAGVAVTVLLPGLLLMRAEPRG
jgi:hypothetical protein